MNTHSSDQLSDTDGRLIAEIDAALETFLDGVDLPAKLKHAARHAVLAGGRRLGPCWC